MRPGAQLHGRARAAAGHRAAAGLRDARPARGSARSCRRACAAYDPAWLDALCLSGEVTWGRLAAREAGGAPNRAAPIALVRRRDLRLAAGAPRATGMDDEARSRRRRATCSAFLRDGGRQLPRRASCAAARPPARRGRGRAVGAGGRGPRHGRRLRGPARAHLGDAEPRQRARALARALDRAATGGRRWARAAGRCCAPPRRRRRRRRARGAGAAVPPALRRRVPRSARARAARARRGAICCASTAASRCAARCAADAWWRASWASSSRRPRRWRPARDPPRAARVAGPHALRLRSAQSGRHPVPGDRVPATLSNHLHLKNGVPVAQTRAEPDDAEALDQPPTSLDERSAPATSALA